jgi:hypothetical protein
MMRLLAMLNGKVRLTDTSRVAETTTACEEGDGRC